MIFCHLHRPNRIRLGGRGGRLQLRRRPCQAHPFRVRRLLWHLCCRYVSRSRSFMWRCTLEVLVMLICWCVQVTRRVILRRRATRRISDTWRRRWTPEQTLSSHSSSSGPTLSSSFWTTAMRTASPVPSYLESSPFRWISSLRDTGSNQSVADCTVNFSYYYGALCYYSGWKWVWTQPHAQYCKDQICLTVDMWLRSTDG